MVRRRERRTELRRKRECGVESGEMRGRDGKKSKAEAKREEIKAKW